MGIFDKLKIKVVNKVLNWAGTVRGYAPTFTSFGEDIMNDDMVQSIINRILDEYSKLNPRHIRTVKGRQVTPADNNINNLLYNPNPYMTKSDFLRKCAWLREVHKNVYIYPTYDLYRNKKTGITKKVYTGLYPLQPRKVDLYEDEQGTLYIEFQLPNGEYSGKILYDDVIHWRKDYGPNDYLGGDENGLPSNSALLRNLELNDKLIQSTVKTIEGSLTINGVLKYGGLINDADREKARQKFEDDLKNNKSGIVALDSGGDYIPIPFNGKLIDKDTLDYFEKKKRQHFGVSEAILNGDYTNQQKEAFYETVLEAGVISLGEAFSRVMLTPFERSNGNAIIFYTNRIHMMSDESKRAWANILLPVGGVTPNTVLSWIGEPPYEGGDDRYISLNWVRKDIADEYQLEKYKYGNITNNNNASNSENNDNDETNDDMIKVGDTNE